MKSFLERLKEKTKKKKSYIINKDIESLSVDTLFKRIREDFPSQSSNFNVLYVYSLVNCNFAYPNGESPIIYIGETEGELYKKKKDLAFRFSHCKDGKDNKINCCLRYYYQKGMALQLDIYLLDDESDIKKEEKLFRKQFLDIYKAYPIADGATNKK